MIINKSNIDQFISGSVMNCYNKGITNIEYIPDNITHLDCSNNKLTYLPLLPNSLTHLDCYDNQLTSYPTCSLGKWITNHNRSIKIKKLLYDYK